MPRLVSLSPPIAPLHRHPHLCLHLHLTMPPCTVVLLASPSTTIPSLAVPAPTTFSPVNQAHQTPHLPNSTMSEREPCIIHMSRDWSNLPCDILDLCCPCMDILSALRLAACSRDMHTAVVEVRPKLFKTPYLLLSSLARLAHHDTEAYMMPLDFNPISVTQLLARTMINNFNQPLKTEFKKIPTFWWDPKYFIQNF